MEQIRKFLEALRTSPKAKELLGTNEPETKEEALSRYVSAAEALGFSLTAEEIDAGLNKLAEEQKAKTAAAEQIIKGLSMEELAMASGGTDDIAPAVEKGNEKCKATYNANENCGKTDRCNAIFLSYDDEYCKATYNCFMVML